MTVTPMSSSSVAFRGVRTGAITASPRVRSTRTTAVPTKPVAPEIQIRRGPVPSRGCADWAAGVAAFGRGRRGFDSDFGLVGVAAGLVGLAAGLVGVAAGFDLAGPGRGAFARRVRGRGSVMPSAPGAATDQ
jgi:hypothetical protein